MLLVGSDTIAKTSDTAPAASGGATNISCTNHQQQSAADKQSRIVAASCETQRKNLSQFSVLTRMMVRIWTRVMRVTAVNNLVLDGIFS